MSDFKDSLSLNGVAVSLVGHTHSGGLIQLGYAESLGSSSTTSTTFQTKVTLNFSLTSASTVKFFWTGICYTTTANKTWNSRIILDGSTIIYNCHRRDSIINSEFPICGLSSNLALASGSHTALLQYRAVDSSMTAFIYNASMSANMVN